MRCGQRKLLPRPMRCSRVKPRETEGTGRGISANPILVQLTGGSQVHLVDGGNSRQAEREEQDKSSQSSGRDRTRNHVELALTISEGLVEARFTFCCGPYG